MNYCDEINKIVAEMVDISRIVHNEMKRLPKGHLSISKEKEYIKYRQDWEEKNERYRTGIGRKPELVQKLAKKAYYKEYLRRLDEDILALRQLARKLNGTEDAAILANLPAHFDLLDPAVFRLTSGRINPVFTDAVAPCRAELFIPEAERDGWGEKPYRANAVRLDTLRIRTLAGIDVRSKSEGGLLDIYRNLDIPVHYDEVVLADGRQISPDFRGLRADGAVIYHEHWGLVNNREYIADNYRKLATYQTAGIVPWRNLIITYDDPDGGIDLELAEAEIRSKYSMKNKSRNLK